MGHTLLQIGRIAMAAFWFTFILVALNMALVAYRDEVHIFTILFFLVAAYAGFGMLIGMVARFIQARDTERVRVNLEHDYGA